MQRVRVQALWTAVSNAVPRVLSHRFVRAVCPWSLYPPTSVARRRVAGLGLARRGWPRVVQTVVPIVPMCDVRRRVARAVCPLGLVPLKSRRQSVARHRETDLYLAGHMQMRALVTALSAR